MTNETTLPSQGVSKLSTVLRLVSMSKTMWYDGINHGIYPKPLKIGTRASAWRNQDILDLLESFTNEEPKPFVSRRDNEAKGSKRLVSAQQNQPNTGR